MVLVKTVARNKKQNQRLFDVSESFFKICSLNDQIWEKSLIKPKMTYSDTF